MEPVGFRPGFCQVSVSDAEYPEGSWPRVGGGLAGYLPGKGSSGLRFESSVDTGEGAKELSEAERGHVFGCEAMAASTKD